MRLERLELRAFGPFTDVALDLGGTGLQVVYGHNGAGKSTALRAVEGLLYGIPERTDDAWHHQPSALRIGARLRGPDDALHEVVRRKGRKNTLLDPDGRPLDAALLSGLLGGLSRDAFLAGSCLGPDDLRTGGAALLDAGGELGAALFGASAGGEHARRLLRALRQEADALFVPRGRNQEVPRALERHTRLVAEAQAAVVPPAEWEERREALARARADHERVADERRAVLRELDRDRRLDAVLGPLAEHAGVRADLGALADVPDLAPEARGERVAAEERRTQAADEARRAGTTADRLALELDHLTRLPALLARRTEIERLVPRLAVVDADRERHRRLQGELAGARDRVRETLRAIDPALLDRAEAPTIPVELAARVRERADEHAALRTALETTEAAVAETDRQVAARKREADAPGADADPSPLAAALRAAADEGDLEARRRRLATDLRTAERTAEGLLARLPRTAGVPADVVRLPVPRVATVRAAEEEHAALATRRAALETARETTDAELADVTAALDELERSADVPSPEGLHAAREHRDAGWAAVRAAWLEQDDEPGRAFAADRPLAEAFAGAVTDADVLADRLRDAADRVARRAELLARRTRLRDEAAARAEDLAEVDADEARARDAWSAAWAPSGIVPGTPTEMRDWLEAHAELVRAAAEVDDRRAQLEETEASIEVHARALGEALRAAGGTAVTDGLLAVRDEAERLLGVLGDRRRAREHAAAALADLRPRAAEQRTAHEAAVAALERWRTAWAQDVARLGLDAGATPKVAQETLAVWDRLGTHRREVERLERELAGLDESAEAFAGEVATLTMDLAADPAAADAVAGLLPAGVGVAAPRGRGRARRRKPALAAAGGAGRTAPAGTLPLFDGPETGETTADHTTTGEDATGGRAPVDATTGPDRTGDDDAHASIDALAAAATALGAGFDAGATLAGLRDRLATALEHETRAADLEERVAGERERAREARARGELAAAALDRLCAAAHVDDTGALPEVEERAGRKRELRAELDRLAGVIRAEGKASVDELERAAADTEPDVLRARIRDAEERAATLEREQQAAGERIGSARSELERIDGGQRAAALEGEAQSALAEVREGARRYATARLAARMLQDAIDDYRERSRGPVLDRAGDLFPELTDGAFTGVRTDYGDDDRPVLLAERGDEHVAVDRLSDGERDQLHLALRVATIEHLLEGAPPVPLVLDDLLLNFDDDRARAGFRVLAALAERTQVVLFTHHRHLVDLAREALGTGMTEHALPAR